MDNQERVRLINECAEAQSRYQDAIQRAKRERREVFARVLATPVTGREVAEVTGLSLSAVSAIARGVR